MKALNLPRNCGADLGLEIGSDLELPSGIKEGLTSVSQQPG